MESNISLAQLQFFTDSPFRSISGENDGNALECMWLYNTDEDLVNVLLHLGCEPQWSREAPMDSAFPYSWKPVTIHGRQLWLKNPGACDLFDDGIPANVQLSDSAVTVNLNMAKEGSDYREEDLQRAYLLEQRYLQVDVLVSQAHRRKRPCYRAA